MDEWLTIRDVVVAGSFYTLFTCGAVLIAVRVIRGIRDSGRADRATQTRIALLYLSGLMIMLGGMICFASVCAALLISLVDMSPRMLMTIGTAFPTVLKYAISALYLGPVLLLMLATGQELRSALLSFSSVRWLVGRAAAIWLRVRETRLIKSGHAMVRRVDRRLW